MAEASIEVERLMVELLKEQEAHRRTRRELQEARDQIFTLAQTLASGYVNEDPDGYVH